MSGLKTQASFVPKYKDWMEQTGIMGKMRSGALRKLDDAIRAYEVSNGSKSSLDQVGAAYRAWRREKPGQGSENSDRNRPPHYPVTTISNFLSKSVTMSPEEQQAFKDMMEMRRETLRAAFSKATVEFGHKFSITKEFAELKNGRKLIEDQTKSIFGDVIGGGMVDLAHGAKTRITGAKLPFDKPKPQPNWVQNPAYAGKAKTVQNPLFGNQKAEQILTGQKVPTQLSMEEISEAAKAMSDLTGIDIGKVATAAQIASAIKNYILQTCADTIKEGPATALFTYLDHLGEALPVVSLVVGGFKTLKAAAATAKASYDSIQTRRSQHQFEKGEPAAALRGVIDSLDEELKYSSIDTIIETVTLSVNAALHGTVAGAAAAPIVKIVKFVIQTIIAIIKLGLQVKVFLSIKKILGDVKNITIAIFDKAPVLGAYFLLTSDHSTIFSMLATSFGKPGWMDEVEAAMKDHIKPVLTRCQKLIEKQPYKLNGIPKIRSFEASASFSGVGESIGLHKFG